MLKLHAFVQLRRSQLLPLLGYCEPPTVILLFASIVQDMLGIRGKFLLAASAVKVCKHA